MKALIWGLIAFLVSAGGSEMIRRGAARLRLLDVPNERSSHVQATPRGAGLALAVASGLALWGCHPWQLSLLLPLLGCQFSIAAIGLIDDMVSLPSLARLAVHVGVAGAFLAFYGDMPGIAAIWPAVPAFAGAVLSIAWLVGLTNAYNFMDGVDGMAGTQGVVAGAGWLLLGGIAGDPLLALLGGASHRRVSGFCCSTGLPRGSSWETSGVASWGLRSPR